MIHNVYVIVVVLFRLAATSVVLSALYVSLGAALVGMFVGHMQAVSLFPLVFAAVFGVVLWVIAKPVARLVTANVE
jgi:hypothetical protein